MNAGEIRLLVAKGIDGHLDRTNLHGCVLRNCLVEPRKANVSFEHSNGSLEVWLVLEKKPNEAVGYAVCWIEGVRRFALVYRSNPDRLVHVGDYGGLLEAIAGM